MGDVRRARLWLRSGRTGVWTCSRRRACCSGRSPRATLRWSTACTPTPQVMRYVATGPMADLAVTERLLAGLRRPPEAARLLVLGGDRAGLGRADRRRRALPDADRRGRARLHARRGVVGARLRDRGRGGLAGVRVLVARDLRGGRPGRARQRRLAARAGEARDAAVGRADRLRPPSRRLPHSASAARRV